MEDLEDFDFDLPDEHTDLNQVDQEFLQQVQSQKVESRDSTTEFNQAYNFWYFVLVLLLLLFFCFWSVRYTIYTHRELKSRENELREMGYRLERA